MTNVVATVSIPSEKEEQELIAVAETARVQAHLDGKSEGEALTIARDARLEHRKLQIIQQGDVDAARRRIREVYEKYNVASAVPKAAPATAKKKVGSTAPATGATPAPATAPTPVTVPPTPQDLATKQQLDELEKENLRRRGTPVPASKGVKGKKNKHAKRLDDHLTQDQIDDLMRKGGIIIDDLPLNNHGHAKRLLAMTKAEGRVKFEVRKKGGDWIMYHDDNGTWTTLAAPQRIGGLLLELSYVMLDWADQIEAKIQDPYLTPDEQLDYQKLFILLVKEHSRIQRSIAAIRTVASCVADFHIHPDKFDVDKFKLAVGNGVLDLSVKPVKRVDHSPENYITKALSVSYVKTAKAPTWRAFVRDLFDDAAVENWVQRFSGYCLTGDIDEHVAPFFPGKGGTGKSTYWSPIRHILGDFAAIAQRGIFREDEFHWASTSSIVGRRLIVDTEFMKGTHLHTGNFRSLIGEDHHSPNPKLEKLVNNVAITAKFAFITNNLPLFDISDEDTASAMYRRLFVVRVNPDAVKGDVFDSDAYLKFPVKLRNESEGILAWMVEGEMMRRQQSLRVKVPALMTEWKDEYFADLGRIVIDPFEAALTAAGYEWGVEVKGEAFVNDVLTALAHLADLPAQFQTLKSATLTRRLEALDGVVQGDPRKRRPGGKSPETWVTGIAIKSQN